MRVRDLEELRRDLDEPLRFDRGDVVAVFARGEDEFVVETPFGVAVEQGGGRVDVYGGPLDEGFVPFLRVLFGCVSEVAGADCAADAVEVFACGQDVVFVSVPTQPSVSLSAGRKRRGGERRTDP